MLINTDNELFFKMKATDNKGRSSDMLPFLKKCSTVAKGAQIPKNKHTFMSAHTHLLAFSSYLPVCFSISNIFAWKTGSTASTLTPYQQNNCSEKLDMKMFLFLNFRLISNIDHILRINPIHFSYMNKAESLKKCFYYLQICFIAIKVTYG